MDTLFPREFPYSGWSRDQWEEQCHVFERIEQILDQLQDPRTRIEVRAAGLELIRLLPDMTLFPRPHAPKELDQEVGALLDGLERARSGGLPDTEADTAVSSILLSVHNGLIHYLYYNDETQWTPMPQTMDSLERHSAARAGQDAEGTDQTWRTILTNLKGTDFDWVPELSGQYTTQILQAGIRARVGYARAWDLCVRVCPQGANTPGLEELVEGVLGELGQLSEEAASLAEAWAPTWTGSLPELMNAAQDITSPAVSEPVKRRSILARLRGELNAHRSNEKGR